MPRPAKILEYGASLYALIGAGGLAFALASEFYTEHGWFTGGGARHPIDAATAISFVIWLLSVAWTGWRNMDRLSGAA